MGFYFDPMYFLFIAPGLLFGLWAQWKVKTAYAETTQIRNRRGWTGARVAEEILRATGVEGVSVESTPGFLSDHYHPLLKKLRLSEQNYSGTSLAAAGVAAHEVGHAIQHARGYLPLQMRSLLVPLCQMGNWIGQVAMMIGLGLMYAAHSPAGKTILIVAILGYSAVFLFTLITLPVEFNASSRALVVLQEHGLLDADEIPQAKKVLDAAALTYVASAVQVLLVLLYLLSLLNRRRD